MKYMISSSLYPNKIDIISILQIGKQRHMEIQPCPKPHNWQGGPGLEPIKSLCSHSLFYCISQSWHQGNAFKLVCIGVAKCHWEMYERERRKNVVQGVSAGTDLSQSSTWLQWAVGQRFSAEHPFQHARQSAEHLGFPQGVGVFIGSECPMGNFPPKFQFSLCQDK